MSSKNNGSLVSPGTVLSVFCLLLYSAGFIRIELKFNDHDQRLVAVEEVISKLKHGMAETSNKDVTLDTESKEERNEAKLQRIARSAVKNPPSNNSANLKQILEEVVTTSFKKICQSSGTLNVLPRGPPGYPGIPGSKGDKGEQGRRGRKCSKGIKGQPGRNGRQGLMGPPGKMGEKGIKGDIGAPGIPGIKGAVGAPGEKGAVGEPGRQGFMGPPGKKGEKGIKGNIGVPGVPGIKGIVGVPGTPGARGTPGTPGTPGARGTPGTPGARDTPGTPGARGTPGTPGEGGTPGTPGAKVCEPVGVEDRNTIPDARMTASTFHNDWYYPYYGRLHESVKHGAWCPMTKSDRTDYLQVDMGTVRSVCAVATQGGKNSGERSTSYILYLSTDEIKWNVFKENNAAKVFPGNTEGGNTIVKHSLSTDVRARFVRFYPVTFQSFPCLRVEIFVLK